MPAKRLTVNFVKQIAAECGVEITESLMLPTREAKYDIILNKLHSDVIATLRHDYPKGLYQHQTRALSAYLEGNDITLSTSTASGKSLVFITAAMDTLLKDSTAKVLALYPAKALIRDQLAKWEGAATRTSASVAYIDGTISTERRHEILKSNRILLMTPDVAHAWLMSNLREREVLSFRNAIRLVILDEAHVYDGVFGTNMAYFMRRLDAVTAEHRVLCSTATLERPSEFIYQLTGRRTVSIGPPDDGAPAPIRNVLLAKDPGYDRLVDLLRRFAAVERGRFLAFGDSRRMVEQVVAATQRIDNTSDASDAESFDRGIELNESPTRPAAEESHQILPFRAGYESEDAKDIQTAFWRGKLGGVVSTSSLELGLDIGEIDLVVLLGVPPSTKAFWQRLGRAGRQRDGVCLVLDRKGTLTGRRHGLRSYLSKTLEPNWLYLDNRYLQYANVLCAALECTELGTASVQHPFDSLPSTFRRLLENELNPTEIVPVDLYPLKQRAQAGPHREFPLRSGVERNFKIRTSQGIGLGQVTFSQMLREAYPGAIYYYMARPYRVFRMDTRDGNLAVRHERYWTTKAIGNTMVFPRFNGGVHSLYGAEDGFWVEAEVQVSERVLGFQEMRGGTKLEPHKYGPASPWCRRELTRFFGTTGVSWHLANRAACSEEIAWRVLQAFCLDYGVQERDLGVGLFHAKQTPFGPVDKCQGVCVYDAVDGSLRLTQRLAENFVGILKSAATYARAEGAQEIADQLLAAYNVFADMAPVQLANGRMVEHLSISEDWTEIIAAGERAIYLSQDGPREVTVIGHRFTPKGLMYDLVPEKDAENSRWAVSHAVLQPMHGFTRTVWVDLVTGEERQTPLAEPSVQPSGALCPRKEFGTGT